MWWTGDMVYNLSYNTCETLVLVGCALYFYHHNLIQLCYCKSHSMDQKIPLISPINIGKYNTMWLFHHHNSYTYEPQPGRITILYSSTFVFFITQVTLLKNNMFTCNFIVHTLQSLCYNQNMFWQKFYIIFFYLMIKYHAIQNSTIVFT